MNLLLKYYKTITSRHNSMSNIKKASPNDFLARWMHVKLFQSLVMLFGLMYFLPGNFIRSFTILDDSDIVQAVVNSRKMRPLMDSRISSILLFCSCLTFGSGPRWYRVSVLFKT